MKIIYFVIIIFSLFFHNLEAKEPKEVVIFTTKSCPFCNQLKEDLVNIRINNPDVNFIVLNLEDKEENLKLLQKMAREHKIRDRVGLPLVFVGKNYFMGWGGKESENLLLDYIKKLK